MKSNLTKHGETEWIISQHDAIAKSSIGQHGEKTISCIAQHDEITKLNIVLHNMVKSLNLGSIFYHGEI